MTRTRQAFVTLAMRDTYAFGCLILAHSLRKQNTQHNLVVMVTDDLSTEIRDLLAKTFDDVVQVPYLDGTDERIRRPDLSASLTKLECWNLTKYCKCVFLDCDTMALQNCDELFNKEELTATPDIGWPDCFNSGVFVYKPSNETYNTLIRLAHKKGSFDGGEQGLLNSYFGKSWSTDIQKRLSFVYNVVVGYIYTHAPAFKQFGSMTKIARFTGHPKPWLAHWNYTEGSFKAQYLDPNTQHPFLQQWLDVFRDHVYAALPQICHELTEDGSVNTVWNMLQASKTPHLYRKYKFVKEDTPPEPPSYNIPFRTPPVYFEPPPPSYYIAKLILPPLSTPLLSYAPPPTPPPTFIQPPPSPPPPFVHPPSTPPPRVSFKPLASAPAHMSLKIPRPTPAPIFTPPAVPPPVPAARSKSPKRGFRRSIPYYLPFFPPLPPLIPEASRGTPTTIDLSQLPPSQLARVKGRIKARLQDKLSQASKLGPIPPPLAEFDEPDSERFAAVEGIVRSERIKSASPRPHSFAPHEAKPKISPTKIPMFFFGRDASMPQTLSRDASMTQTLSSHTVIPDISQIPHPRTLSPDESEAGGFRSDLLGPIELGEKPSRTLPPPPPPTPDQSYLPSTSRAVTPERGRKAMQELEDMAFTPKFRRPTPASPSPTPAPSPSAVSTASEISSPSIFQPFEATSMPAPVPIRPPPIALVLPEKPTPALTFTPIVPKTTLLKETPSPTSEAPTSSAFTAPEPSPVKELPKRKVSTGVEQPATPPSPEAERPVGRVSPEPRGVALGLLAEEQPAKHPSPEAEQPARLPSPEAVQPVGRVSPEEAQARRASLELPTVPETNFVYTATELSVTSFIPSTESIPLVSEPTHSEVRSPPTRMPPVVSPGETSLQLPQKPSSPELPPSPPYSYRPSFHDIQVPQYSQQIQIEAQTDTASPVRSSSQARRLASSVIEGPSTEPVSSRPMRRSEPPSFAYPPVSFAPRPPSDTGFRDTGGEKPSTSAAWDDLGAAASLADMMAPVELSFLVPEPRPSKKSSAEKRKKLKPTHAQPSDMTISPEQRGKLSSDRISKRDWEQGAMDYMGRDKFENIQKKLDLLMKERKAEEDAGVLAAADYIDIADLVESDLDLDIWDWEDDEDETSVEQELVSPVPALERPSGEVRQVSQIQEMTPPEEGEEYESPPQPETSVQATMSPTDLPGSEINDFTGMREWESGRIDTSRHTSDNILQRLNYFFSQSSNLDPKKK